MPANKLTTAQRSQAAKAAAAQRRQDQWMGIPSIAALTETVLAEFPGASRASARREAVRQIEELRANGGLTGAEVQERNDDETEEMLLAEARSFGGVKSNRSREAAYERLQAFRTERGARRLAARREERRAA